MSDGDPLDDQAGQLAKAVFEFVEALRPTGGVFSGLVETSSLIPVDDPPPYVHRLGATHGPAFSVRRLLPSWEPPLPQFGTWVTPVKVFPVKAERQEVPEAFRRR